MDLWGRARGCAIDGGNRKGNDHERTETTTIYFQINLMKTSMHHMARAVLCCLIAAAVSLLISPELHAERANAGVGGVGAGAGRGGGTAGVGVAGAGARGVPNRH